MKHAIVSAVIFAVFILNAYAQVPAKDLLIEVHEVGNSIFTADAFWRGADGAASVDLENGTILWLFSDTFIDPRGTGSRRKARMINNSLAIQKGHSWQSGTMSFYYKGKKGKPRSFFELPGKNWFWTGHGIMANNHLILFLFEETSTRSGIGFEAIGWYIAIINNPLENPHQWNIRYIKGSDTFGVIAGSSAILKDNEYLYAYGVTEPATHEVYLLRFPLEAIIEGDISGLEWWYTDHWSARTAESQAPTPLFTGQTEFSVHYQENLRQYVQIQTYGYGAASIGYRLADRPEGPWSQPVIFYQTQLDNPAEDFVYSANAHPEISLDGLLITYNVNTANFSALMMDETIYFPKCIRVNFTN